MSTLWHFIIPSISNLVKKATENDPFLRFYDGTGFDVMDSQLDIPDIR